MEEQIPPAVIYQTSDGIGNAAVMVGKPSTFKILIFDETGPRKLYHKKFLLSEVGGGLIS